MVVMGRVTAPFGVKGWVKIYALTAQPGNLCDYPVWWLGRDGDWREMQVTAAKVHGNTLVAQFAGVADREAAIALKGLEVAVPREQLPGAAEDEFYWADLIGLAVVNGEGVGLGTVQSLIETGANDVLVVRDGEVERLLPFVDAVVRKVDVPAGRIEVEWGADW